MITWKLDCVINGYYTTIKTNVSKISIVGLKSKDTLHQEVNKHYKYFDIALSLLAIHSPALCNINNNGNNNGTKYIQDNK